MKVLEQMNQNTHTIPESVQETGECIVSWVLNIMGKTQVQENTKTLCYEAFLFNS